MMSYSAVIGRFIWWWSTLLSSSERYLWSGPQGDPAHPGHTWFSILDHIGTHRNNLLPQAVKCHWSERSFSQLYLTVSSKCKNCGDSSHPRFLMTIEKSSWPTSSYAQVSNSLQLAGSLEPRRNASTLGHREYCILQLNIWLSKQACVLFFH